MKTGIELIAIERQEQIEKHGYKHELTKANPKWYNDHQLSRVASLLCSPETGSIAKVCPIDTAIAFGYIENWDSDWLRYAANKPYKDRIIIAGALIAAEIDRLHLLKITEDTAEAEALKGKKLSKNEHFLISQFANDPLYEMKLYSKEHGIGYHLK